MTQSPRFPKYFRLLIIMLIPFALILGSIRILTADAYLTYEYNKPGFPSDLYGFSTSERLKLGSAGLQYVREPLPIGFLAGQNINNQPAFSDRELSHMQDVQAVFQLAWKVGLIILVALGAALIYMGFIAKARISLASALQTGGFLTSGLVAVVGLLAVVGWNQWFTVFHTLFFPPGSWTFEFSDTLIRLYPMQFWFDSALTVAGITFISGIGMGWMGKIWKHKIAKITEAGGVSRVRKALA